MTIAAQAVNNSPVVTVSTTVSEKYKRRDFIKIDQHILHATEVNGIQFTGNMKLVYMAMLSYQRDNKRVFYTREQMAVMCGLTERTVTTLIQTMTSAGLIAEIQGGARKSNVYRLNEYVIQTVETDQNASHPTAKRKPKLSIVENKEQPNDDSLNVGGDDVQSCDPLPVITDVIDSVQPKEEATNDSVLPVNGGDNDRSDEVITADVKDDLEMYTQIADNFGVVYNLTEILNMCHGDRTKAAKRLKGEVDAFHNLANLAKQNAQKPAQLVVDGGFDDGWDDSEGDAY